LNSCVNCTIGSLEKEGCAMSKTTDTGCDEICVPLNSNRQALGGFLCEACP
jgi:uncharacterized metal-binding protein